jgi:hypothetical protein
MGAKKGNLQCKLELSDVVRVKGVGRRGFLFNHRTRCTDDLRGRKQGVMMEKKLDFKVIPRTEIGGQGIAVRLWEELPILFGHLPITRAFIFYSG